MGSQLVPQQETQVEIRLRPEALSVETELDSWLIGIKARIAGRLLTNLTDDTDGMDRYIEFAEISELPGCFIACAFYQKDINDALTRAGIYMGAGKGLKAGTLIGQRDFSLINYKKLVAGHNLPGSVVCNFFACAAESTVHDKAMNAAESAVAVYFLKDERVTRLSGNFYLIGVSIQTMKDQKGVISHEIFHAYRFLNHQYRDVVANFWRSTVTSEDKSAITKEIGIAYNIDDEDLVIDEFQAYLVQTGADKDRMRAFVPKYREKLLRSLSEANISLLKI